jgi:hypothetical protein
MTNVIMGSSQAILKLKCERLLKTFCLSHNSEKCPSEYRILKKCPTENEAISPSEHDINVFFNSFNYKIDPVPPHTQRANILGMVSDHIFEYFFELDKTSSP